MTRPREHEAARRGRRAARPTRHARSGSACCPVEAVCAYPLFMDALFDTLVCLLFVPVVAVLMRVPYR